ncbi:MAG: SH3 domain-containing protein [Gammaproteobacteria bacterium]|nr:SH3 domain-containing protein [Gammaproteobacteria bacterium]
MIIKKGLAATLFTFLIFVLLPQGVVQAQSFFDQLNSFGKALSGQQQQNGNSSPSPTKKEAPPPNPTGTLKKGSNVRSGPGTSHGKLGMAGTGSHVEILGEQGNWYQVETNINGKNTAGWIYKPLVVLNTGHSGKIANSASGSTQPQVRSDGSVISYAGYSKAFQPVKQMMEKGDLNGVAHFYDEREKEIRAKLQDSEKLIDGIGLLRWLERGTLSIDQGQLENSVSSFDNAETVLKGRQNESKLTSWFKSAAQFSAETALGNEELQAYPGEGYERVLMLNYKSIAYLLQGERKAYNVTRRAIDWQNMEKKAFEKKLREAKDDLTKKNQERSQKGDESDLSGRVSQDYAALDAKAKTVPSAYVNPFGYYVAGMIQEYESYDDWSLRDNARISYNKALALNPKSKTLKKAAREMKKRNAPAGTRLVHIVVADGFVPEKKMISYAINAGQQSVPIKLPIYEPVKTRVHRIEVQTSGGKRLATLSPIADIEALCLRHQKDSEPFRQLRVTLAVASSVVTKGVLSNLGFVGQAISEQKDQMAAPDMRSWMSLPSTIQAARLHLRRGVSKLKIVSYDRRGRRLASKTVNINKRSHDFVYARSINRMIYADASREMWMLAGK